MAFTLTPTQLKNEPILDTEDFYLNMGPHHPSTHGVLRVLLKMNGEIVREATPYFGYLHRCFDKKAESLKYPQIVPYTDRLDYLAGMANNMAYVLGVERLMDLEVPRRADLIRIIALELQRIASHQFWLSAFANDLGSSTMLMYCMRDREAIVDLYEMMCGARLTYHFIRIGGVMRDWDERMDEKCREILKVLMRMITEYEDLLTGNEIFRMRVEGIGYLSPEDAVAFSASGPYLRASGIPYDIRRTQPYSLYPEMEFDVQVSDKCDCLGRYEIRINEMYESIRIIHQCLDKMKETQPGEHMAELPRVLKVPAGEVYAATESPKGELGIYIVSDGTDKPFRCHARAPSFVNLNSLGLVGSGHMLADFVAILGSVDIVLGEVDR